MGTNARKRQSVAERRAAALTMRRNGASYAELADRLDYSSAQHASKDVHRALDGLVAEQGKALLSLERERTEALWQQLWPLVVKGDTSAARESIRLLERRARLLGLDKAAAQQFAADSAHEAKGILGNLADVLGQAYDELPDHDDLM